MEPALLTIDQAAEYLNIGRANLYTLLQPDGPIPAVNVGTLVRIPRDALDEWVRSLPPRVPGPPHNRQQARAREA